MFLPTLFEVPVDEAFQSIVSNALLMEQQTQGRFHWFNVERFDNMTYHDIL